MKIIELIRSALRSTDATTSDLRHALASIDLPRLDAAVAEARLARAALLLDGSDAQIDKADEALTGAIRERDRAQAASEELRRRIEQLEADQVNAALDAERDATEREAQHVAKLLADRWLNLQTEMVSILDRLSDAEDAVREVNKRLVFAGRDHDRIQGVEVRTFSPPQGQLASVHSIINRTQLMGIAEVPGWSDPVQVAGGVDFIQRRA